MYLAPALNMGIPRIDLVKALDIAMMTDDEIELWVRQMGMEGEDGSSHCVD